MSLHWPLALIVPRVSQLANLFYINKQLFLKHPLSFCSFDKSERVFSSSRWQQSQVICYFSDRMTRLNNINWPEFSSQLLDPSFREPIWSVFTVQTFCQSPSSSSDWFLKMLLVPGDAVQQHSGKVNFIKSCWKVKTVVSASLLLSTSFLNLFIFSLSRRFYI